MPESVDTATDKKVAETTKGKKQPKQFYLMRRWPNVEEGLTEIEGRALEAMQRWRIASSNAQRMGELDATELLEGAMFEAQAGTLLSFCSDSGLTTKDACALARVYRIWQRWATQSEKNARLIAKHQRKAAKATKKGAQN